MKEKAAASSKCILFKHLIEKLDYRCHAWYLDHIDRKNVNALTRFRLRNHCLAIETGDWDGTPIEGRTCSTCEEVEDEAHFVFECTRYEDLRDQYIKVEFDPSRCAQEQLVDLLLCKDKRKLDNLGIYIHKAMAVHKRYARERAERNT